MSQTRLSGIFVLMQGIRRHEPDADLIHRGVREVPEVVSAEHVGFDSDGGSEHVTVILIGQRKFRDRSLSVAVRLHLGRRERAVHRGDQPAAASNPAMLSVRCSTTSARITAVQRIYSTPCVAAHGR